MRFIAAVIFVLLLGAQTALHAEDEPDIEPADLSPVHWLIGRWWGNIDHNQYNSTREMQVTHVGPSGDVFAYVSKSGGPFRTGGWTFKFVNETLYVTEPNGSRYEFRRDGTDTIRGVFFNISTVRPIPFFMTRK